MASPKHLSGAQYDAAYAGFTGRYPGYAATAALDRLRQTEYKRLDERGDVYLDYTGAGLFADSQLEEHLTLLRSGVFGNPHSGNPTSTAMTTHLESARRAVLNYFNASVDEYTVVFTLNASGALKLVGEAFPFAPRSRLLLTFDNHNSVNGIREFATAKGAAIDYAPLLTPSLRLDPGPLNALLDRAEQGCENLFAFPAQSNFSGVKHPLEWIATAQSKGWRVLLDAAAFVPTNRLDLEALQAGLCHNFVLQNVWLSDGRRRVADPQAGSRLAAAALVRGRHGKLCVGAGAGPRTGRRRSCFGRRHAEFPFDSGRRDRAAPP